MRKLVAIAGFAWLAAGCAGGARPVGPADIPVPGAVDVPAAVTPDTGLIPEPPAAPLEPRELEPLPLPSGVSADDFDITVEYNRRVEAWVEYFQRYRGTFAAWLERMSRYEPFIRRELTSAGLPGDLIYLGLIESGFTPSAVSSARAVGIWQFMAETARLEGLEVSTYVDERRDPIRATEAAVSHLRSLYRELGSWYLVAAAYNSGSGRVTRALGAAADGARGADSLFWRIEPMLPSETRDYVPKFLAASLMAKYPDRFGVAPATLPGPDDFDVVHIDRATDIGAVARAAGSSEDLIRRLNPQFYLGVTPPGRRVAVRVPAGGAARVLDRLADMPRRERVHDLHYTANRGDTPKAVAARYGVTLAAFRKANHLKKKTRVLAAGRELVIPLAPPRTLAAAAPERARLAAADREVEHGPSTDSRRRLGMADKDTPASSETTRRERAPSPRVTSATSDRIATSSDSPRETDVARATRGGRSGGDTYRVRAGDTLARIAEAHGTTVARLRELNGLSRAGRIHPGQKLRLAGARIVVYRVQEGDTLWRIAQKHGVTVDDLRDWNGLSAGSVIRPGEEVEVRMER